jgi:hypothetical protein
MLIDPSVLPWWGWLLCGVVGILVAALAGFLTDTAGDTKTGVWLAWLIGVVAGLGGFVAFAIGIVRFAKWAWG